MLSIEDNGDFLTITVEVTNTGDVAGKDVVEIYSTPPDINGVIEQSEYNLIGFDKTDALAPSASETVTIKVDKYDMASYDMHTEECYVLFSGVYTISVMSSRRIR